MAGEATDAAEAGVAGAAVAVAVAVLFLAGLTSICRMEVGCAAPMRFDPDAVVRDAPDDPPPPPPPLLLPSASSSAAAMSITSDGDRFGAGVDGATMSDATLADATSDMVHEELSGRAVGGDGDEMGDGAAVWCSNDFNCGSLCGPAGNSGQRV